MTRLPSIAAALIALAGAAVVSNGLVFFKGEWLLYHGAADRCIGLAVSRPGSAR